MKTYKVWLSIGPFSFVNAQRWAHQERDIVFYHGDSIIASYARISVLKIAESDVIEYEQDSKEK